MTREQALKVQLLLRVPEFREDVEKTASLLGLNESQKEEVVLRTASMLDWGRIEKQASGGAVAKNALSWLWKFLTAGKDMAKAYPRGAMVADAVKNHPHILAGYPAATGSGYLLHKALQGTAEQGREATLAEAAKKVALPPAQTVPPGVPGAKPDLTGLGLGALGGSGLGALIGSELSDGGAMGTGLGAGLGGLGGALLGNKYINEWLSKAPTATA